LEQGWYGIEDDHWDCMEQGWYGIEDDHWNIAYEERILTLLV
jgi:hypothetical protein